MRRLLRVLVSWVCLLGTIAIPVSAQTPAVPSDKLGWELPQDATGLTFNLSVDGVKQTLSGVTCGALSAGISACQAPIPAMTTGTHKLVVMAVMQVGTVSVESGPSNELAISFIAVVTPQGLRLIKG